MAAKLGISVAGATGYTGVELVRLLRAHPEVELRRVTSAQYAGKHLSEVYPSFRGGGDLLLEKLEPETIGVGVDVVFSCLPHGAAASTVARALDAGARVLDLSADFRLKDAEVFRRWYGEHPVPRLLGEAVYGLPELYREALRNARLVAVPGCYPTGALLGLMPLARRGLLGEGVIVVDSKSGASGAGRSTRTDLLFCEVDENVRAYGVAEHRHTPEIEGPLRAAGVRCPIIFAPHLLPIRRGILSTIYVPLRDLGTVEIAFRSAYAEEPFVHLLAAGTFPDVRDVRGTNHVLIGWKEIPDAKSAVIVTAIDNLGKGGAGQAVQCLNVAFGFDERTALDAIAAVP